MPASAKKSGLFYGWLVVAAGFAVIELHNYVFRNSPHTAQELRTASPPLAAFDRNSRVSPLKLTASRENPMKGMKPEPDALRQSAQ